MNHVLLILLGGPVVISTPFALAYLLIQRPADEAAKAARAKADAEREARAAAARNRRRELTR